MSYLMRERGYSERILDPENVLNLPSITDFLKSLGDSSEAVAYNLRRLRITPMYPPVPNFHHISEALSTYAYHPWGKLKVYSNGTVSWGDCQIMDPQTTQAVMNYCTRPLSDIQRQHEFP